MKEYNGIINISEPDNDYSIYLMYSSNKNDNSIYIGVTKDYKQRVYKHSIDRQRKDNQHKPLYIWLNDVIDNQERKILFEVIENKLEENIAFEKEIFYINEYKKLGYTVLNISKGGKGFKGNTPWNKGKTNVYTDDQLKKLSDSHLGQVSGNKGKNHSEKTKQLISLKNKERKEKGWISPKSKKVYKYNNDNLLLTVYLSLVDAGKKENVSPSSVGEWCRNKKKPKNGFKYSYFELN